MNITHSKGGDSNARYEELKDIIVGDADFSYTEVLGRAREAMDALLEKERSLNNE